jgi:hypothetical protein
MTASLSEVIRTRLGWCPGRMAATRSRPFLESSPVSPALPERGDYTMPDVILDFGSTGISIKLVTVILAGTIAGLVAFMRYGIFESWSVYGLLVLILFVLGVALRMLHQDIKKATIAFTAGGLVVWRPLFRPVIIQRETITTSEVRKNIHHSHRWLFWGAMVIFLAGIIPLVLSSGYYHSLSRLISPISFTLFMVYQLAVVVFFGLAFYHGYIRSRYPEVLAICTTDKKIVGLYVDDPGMVSERLDRWRREAV